jgi:hypothetical protein
MKITKIVVVLLLLLTIVNTVGAVTIDETFIMLAGDFTMQTYGEQTYTFISSDGLTYWNMSGSNVTFVTHWTSSHDLIERDGHYGIGNYTTTITADIYGTTTNWTVNNLYLRFITNAGNIENKSYGPTPGLTIAQFNTTHKRVTYEYTPSNTLTETDMGLFDIDIFAVCYNTTLHYWGNRTFNDTFSVYILDPPYNGSSDYDAGTQTVNITWETGNHSDTDVVVRKNGTSYPNSPFDGYIVQNGTLNFFNETANSNRAYSVFSYNNTTRSWSEPLNIPWGAIMIWNVYNESNPFQSIWYNLEVSNAAGTDVYTKYNQHGPLLLDYNDIPFGYGTIFIVSNTSYRDRRQVHDIIANGFYNYSFGLPRITLPTGEGEYENYTRQYKIRVIENILSSPLENVYVEIKRYNNETLTYETLETFYTNGYGEGTLWLIPSTHYKAFLTKENYNDAINDFLTDPVFYGDNYPITFSMSASIGGDTAFYVFIQEIHTSGYIDNVTSILYINYTDDLLGTIDCQVYVYDMNTQTLIYTYLSTDTDSFQTNTIVNKTHDFQIMFKFNHSYFNYREWTFIITGYHLGSGITLTTMIRFNTLFMINFGWNPFGWSNMITWFIMVGCFFSFNRRDSYMAMFLAGFLLLIINYYIGFNTVMATVSGGAIPIMMIFFGILMLIRDRYRFGVDT